MIRYYIDTSIWMDLYEDRKGYNGEPLGDFAWRLFSLLKVQKSQLVITDLLFKELTKRYSIEKIRGMMVLFEGILVKIIATEIQKTEAKKIAIDRNIPLGDALHAIIARDLKAILITRDRHFEELRDICEFYKPENFI